MITEGDQLLAEAFDGADDVETDGGEARAPVVESADADLEGGGDGLAGAGAAFADVRPRKEGKDGAGGAVSIAVIEVVGAGIVEVDGLFDEAEAEYAAVEVDILLRIAGDGGDVVNSGDLHSVLSDYRYLPDSWLRRITNRSRKDCAPFQSPTLVPSTWSQRTGTS